MLLAPCIFIPCYFVLLTVVAGSGRRVQHPGPRGDGAQHGGRELHLPQHHLRAAGRRARTGAREG